MGFIDKIKDFIYNNDSEYEEEMGYEEEATGTDHAAPRTPSVQGRPPHSCRSCWSSPIPSTTASRSPMS